MLPGRFHQIPIPNPFDEDFSSSRWVTVGQPIGVLTDAWGASSLWGNSDGLFRSAWRASGAGGIPR